MRRFDANSLLYITKAIDYFDLSDAHPSLEAALASTRARFFLLTFSSDWLYPPHQLERVASALRGSKRPVEPLPDERSRPRRVPGGPRPAGTSHPPVPVTLDANDDDQHTAVDIERVIAAGPRVASHAGCRGFRLRFSRFIDSNASIRAHPEEADPASGCVVASRMEVSDSDVQMRALVIYAPDAASGLWVPAEMHEQYRRSTDARDFVNARASYSSLRRFQVTTSEAIKVR